MSYKANKNRQYYGDKYIDVVCETNRIHRGQHQGDIHDDISSSESSIQKTDPKSWSAIVNPVDDKTDCLC